MSHPDHIPLDIIASSAPVPIAHYTLEELAVRLDYLLGRLGVAIAQTEGYTGKALRADARDLRLVAEEIRKRAIQVPAAPTVRP